MFTDQANRIFRSAVEEYHRYDDVDRAAASPYGHETVEHLLYLKHWIDAVQWHLEDLIRDPAIDPVQALRLKRRIDASNQQRTDLVEYVDAWLMDHYRAVTPLPDARLNTETPAWALDRLSILHLKIYHMEEQTLRKDCDEAHRDTCRARLEVLRMQREDLSAAIDRLMEEIAAGRVLMRSYKQMKMYNDPSLNPILYGRR